MLTESWPLEYDPELPPKWTPQDGSRPVVVYLDKWCYFNLARDRVGDPVQIVEAGCFEYFRRLALDGRAVFPLSQTHYEEVWRDGNVDRRWDHAVAMAELSGFNALTSQGLALWEAVVAVAEFTGNDIDYGRPNVFGWGHRHCFGSCAPALRIGSPSGGPARYEDMSAEELAKIADVDNEYVRNVSLRC